MTLIELIISLAITAVLVSTVLVSFTMIEGKRLETDARTLAWDLIYARTLAMTTHQNYTVGFEPDTESYNISDEASGVIKRRKLGVDMVNVTDFLGNQHFSLEFHYPSGDPEGAVAEKRVINLQQQGRPRRVRIYDETGFITVE
jgi:Tfp pilus assembly protein FimT